MLLLILFAVLLILALIFGLKARLARWLDAFFRVRYTDILEHRPPPPICNKRTSSKKYAHRHPYKNKILK